jgi:diketogulonate reductase-like aldo/keto reductase
MTATTARTVTLPRGATVPRLGMGTWYLGEDPDGRDIQLSALRTGIEIGLTLIDTAEMYGDGAAEELVGKAVAGRRDDVFLVSKVLPHHATREGTAKACQDSLRGWAPTTWTCTCCTGAGRFRWPRSSRPWRHWSTPDSSPAGA